MRLTKEVKAKIDAMSYEDLLHGWRFTPAGDEMFQGQSGVYWGERMAKMKETCPDHVAISKKIGWGV